MKAMKPSAARNEAPLPLPPLNALRAFESAARHLSFTRAGAELFVTQTAISHQIKQLEEHLGRSLFRRSARGLTLTADGEAWARELRDVFERLESANRRLRGRPAAERPVVAVSVIPSFGAGWLVPRLGRFLAQHPGVDVRISSSGHMVDFTHEEIDLGIRFGFGRYPGLAVEKLAGDALVVVCAPKLRARKRLVSPMDLKKHVLLHDDDPDAWRTWLAAHGPSGVDLSRGIVLTDSHMLVGAAVEGQGVALARWSLAKDDVTAGRLVMPFAHVRPMPIAKGYYLVGLKRTFARPEVRAFRDWLREESAELRT